MSIEIPQVTLNNSVPILGFGVFQVPTEQVVSDALAAGHMQRWINR
ncbi:hypothetical protein ACGFWD_27245 [Streptomyces sp. NPDC048448]